MATRNIYITDTTDPSEDGSIDHPYDAFADINWSTGGANSIFDWVAAGDDVFINLKRGCVWREQLAIGTSGASGHPVTIQAYGIGADPIISGSDDISTAGWAPLGGDKWRHVIGATEPDIVIFDGVVGTEDAGTDAQYEWEYSNPNLDIYSTSDPDDQEYYTLIEAGQRDIGIYVWNKDYVTIDGLHIKHGNDHNIVLDNNSDHIIIQDCTVDTARVTGIRILDIDGSNLIDSNTVYGNGQDGIKGHVHSGSGSGTETVVSNNTVYNNGQDGIHCRATYWIIENNIVYSNGQASTSNGGIHVYAEGGDAAGIGEQNIIRFNIAHTNSNGGGTSNGYGIALDATCDNNEIYYNISYNNDGPGIAVYDAADNNICNNVCYGNIQEANRTIKGEITLVSSVADLTDNINLKNNIALATSANTYAIYVDAETYDNTLDITNNDWYRASGDWYYWDSGGGAVLATWNALAGVGTDLNADPLFVDAAGGDFKLNATSPCRDAGVDVSLTPDYAGRTIPKNHTPDIGAYELFARGVHKKLYNRLGLLL